ncbi:NAD(+) diphosphatase [Desulfobacula sp.]|uniref:NAD(+) diphosphatase n=1 Tax=Desulfobacula sp. TaxID=2593537 RepID=UPI00262D5F50|nr:NAD(+) diphosphatase [Desulfobacula sp.]
MEFIKTAIEPVTASEKAYYFIFLKNDILVKESATTLAEIPCLGEKSLAALAVTEPCFLGRIKERVCYCAQILPGKVPEPYKFINLRSLYGKIENGFWRIAGYARQINDWNMNFTFCGRCGAKTQRKKDEYARACPRCRLVSYPRISPAIITAVIKDDKILLARGINFPNKKMFSVLAGFVEPGEALESCVAREVFEEAGIMIKQIRYFNSQSWPFPDSLMIGFTAVYDSGRLSINPRELIEADWFTADNLPLVPGKQTIAGELIDWFVRQQLMKNSTS